MPSKFIYTSDEHYGSTDALDILSPRQLDELLEDGWDVIKRTKRTVVGPSKRKVQVEYLELSKKSAERGVARVDPDEGASVGGGVMLRDDPNAGQGALINPRGDNGSYLGSGSVFSHLIGRTPGVQVANAIVGDVAFGMGVDAAKVGAGEDAYIQAGIRPGTKPYDEWMKGYRAGSADGGGSAEVQRDTPAMKEAYAAGKRAARLPEDAEVSCPYPPGTALYAEFTRGFAENGGTVV